MSRKFATINRAEMKWVSTPLELASSLVLFCAWDVRSSRPLTFFLIFLTFSLLAVAKKVFTRIFSRRMAAGSVVYQKERRKISWRLVSIHQQSVKFSRLLVNSKWQLHKRRYDKDRHMHDSPLFFSPCSKIGRLWMMENDKGGEEKFNNVNINRRHTLECLFSNREKRLKLTLRS